MSSHQIHLQPVLSAAEYDAIDQFCASLKTPPDIAEVAAFLNTKFSAGITLDPAIVAGFQSDSSNLPGKAAALARPKSEHECAILCRACYKAGIPVTISAGRSNLTGSATPDGGLVLSTANLLTPAPQVDVQSKTTTASPGIIMENLRDDVLRLSGKALQFPINPTSRGDAWIGGAIACNASGFTPGEDGAIRNWVSEIRFILPDGYLVHAHRGEYVSRDGVFELVAPGPARSLPVPRYPRPAIKNASGPFSAPDGAMDFIDLVVGSEGIFGLVAAAVLRLEPRPADYLDLFMSLPAEDDALALLEKLRARLKGELGALTALEYFGVNCRKYMKHENRFFHGDDQVAVYIQVPVREGAADDAAAEWLDLLLNLDAGVREEALLLMDNDRDRALFMEARHSMPAHAVEIVQQRGTYTIMTDTVVPPARFREFLQETHQRLRREGLDYLSFGHLGDCHLHITILPTRGQLQKTLEIYDQIVADCARLGGIYSGEHGTGKRKRGDFVRCFGEEAVRQVHAAKAALDPQFLFNRGNVVLP
jgi:D-lactate dehydrogenase (cytochrome)